MGKPGVLQSMRSQSQALLNNNGINDNEKIRKSTFVLRRLYFSPQGHLGMDVRLGQEGNSPSLECLRMPPASWPQTPGQ